MVWCGVVCCGGAWVFVLDDVGVRRVVTFL